MNKKTLVRSTGHIRIIGGRWRGRKLLVSYSSQGLRPTTNRIRETLFNWLTPVIQGKHCLDCFAGSGALGLEALSRSAASVILLEQNRAISTLIYKNLQLLQASQAKVIHADSLSWLAKTGTKIKFDVVFIDPPFRQGMINNTIALLEYYRHLADKAWIYIETETNNTGANVPDNWQLYHNKIAGQVSYSLYRRHIMTIEQKGTNFLL